MRCVTLQEDSGVASALLATLLDYANAIDQGDLDADFDDDGVRY